MVETPLARQRCFNHATREAVARCPSCARYYCRECITEHGGRVLCATCLDAAGTAAAARRRRLLSLTRAAGFLTGFVMIWVSFLLLGRTLLLIPDAIHGEVTEETWTAPEER